MGRWALTMMLGLTLGVALLGCHESPKPTEISVSVPSRESLCANLVKVAPVVDVCSVFRDTGNSSGPRLAAAVECAERLIQANGFTDEIMGPRLVNLGEINDFFKPDDTCDVLFRRFDSMEAHAVGVCERRGAPGSIEVLFRARHSSTSLGHVVFLTPGHASLEHSSVDLKVVAQSGACRGL